MINKNDVLLTREVRLDQEELAKLYALFNTRLAPYPNATVYLFGSRADPAQRGGDLDLLIISRGAAQNAYELSKKLRMAIVEQLGDQKVDILIYPELDSDDQPAFVQLALREGVQIWP